jgi:hypothetical protein
MVWAIGGAKMIYKYVVRGNHMIFKRYDGYFRSLKEARLIAKELKEAGYEVEIEDIINEEMVEE